MHIPGSGSLDLLNAYVNHLHLDRLIYFVHDRLEAWRNNFDSLLANLIEGEPNSDEEAHSCVEEQADHGWVVSHAKADPSCHHLMINSRNVTTSLLAGATSLHLRRTSPRPSPLTPTALGL